MVLDEIISGQECTRIFIFWVGFVVLAGIYDGGTLFAGDVVVVAGYEVAFH